MTTTSPTLKLKYRSFIKPAFKSPSKYVTITAGRRTGKTYNGALWIIDELITNPDVKSALWVETRHTNIDKYVDRYFRPILKPIANLCKWNQQKKVLSLINNKFIDFGSAERPENLEGFAYDRMFVNEAGITLKKQGLWENTLQPMSKGEDSRVRFVGTPKGKNKFFELAVRGMENQPEWSHFHFSAFDSPEWDPEELERIKKTTPEIVWKQEYLAEFVEGEGSVFRGIENCIRESEPQKCDVMAVDLGKTIDFTVIMIGNTVTKQVVKIDRFNTIAWPLQKKRIVALWNEYGRPLLRVDAGGVGKAIIDDLMNAGVMVDAFNFTSASKQNIVQNLSVAIENEQIFYPRFEPLINELSIFEYQISNSGRIRYAAPEGYHDDCVVTLAMLNDLIQSSYNVEMDFVNLIGDIDEDDD